MTERTRMRLLAGLVVVCGLLALVGIGMAGTAAAEETAPDCGEVGYEEEGGAYLIENLSQLQCIGEHDLGADYELVDDIDASVTAGWNGNAGFKPIGDAGNAFTGTFDGNGHVIKNLRINRSSEDYTGLFGRAVGSEFNDLRLEGTHVRGHDQTGMLGGRFDHGLISNVSVAGDVIADSESREVGGLIGIFLDEIVVERIAVRGSVEGGRAVGGITGQTGWTTDLSIAYSQADVTAKDEFAGGIVGQASNFSSKFAHVYSTGEVSGDRSGGIIGLIQSGGSDVFEESVYWDTDVNEDPYGKDEGGAVTDWTGLTTEEMQGVTPLPEPAGEGTMDQLDWDETWQTISEPGPDYPVFQWQAGEETEISGQVTDGLHDNPIEGITVTAEPDDLTFETVTAETDGDGEFEMTVFDEPTYELSAEAEDPHGPDGAMFTIADSRTIDPAEITISNHELGPDYDGEGTADDPYRVENLEDLQQIRYEPDTNYRLSSDIDATETEDWFGEKGFEPIGDEDTPFTGHFDGNGHVIEGLTIDRPGENEVGLFGETRPAVLVNVTLENATVTGEFAVGGLVGSAAREDEPTEVKGSSVTGTVTGTERVGGLAGWTSGYILDSSAAVKVTGLDDSSSVGGLVGWTSSGNSLADHSRVHDSSATGDVTGTEKVGGLVGHADGAFWGYTDINRSYATGTVMANESAGGLVGTLSFGSIVFESYASGNVEGDFNVGGLVARVLSGDIEQSYATGDVEGSSKVGGLAGTSRGTIAESYSTSTVRGSSEVGGLLGANYESGEREGGEVTDSYASGDVEGNETVGGLVGANTEDGTVTASYATGAVTGTETVGGLVGQTIDEATVTDSYWDVNTTGQHSSAGSANESGLTTRQMTGLNATETMAFDFPMTWHVTDSYPVLEWMETDPFFEATISETNSPVTAGEVLTVTAMVTNWGGDGTETVTLTDTDFTGDQQDETEVSLATGESVDSVVLEWVTDREDVGTGVVAVTGEHDADTADVAVEATSSLSNLDIAGQGEDATITAGESERVSVAVENVDDQVNQFDVALRIGDATETKQTGNLDPGANETVVFENVTGDLELGEYAVTVSTEDDETSGTLTVQTPAESALSNLQIAAQGDDATITEGDDEDVSIDVGNVGDQEGQFTVTLDIGEAMTDTDVSLGPGETETIVFESVTGTLAPGEYTVTVSAGGNTETGTLSVDSEDEQDGDSGGDGSEVTPPEDVNPVFPPGEGPGDQNQTDDGEEDTDESDDEGETGETDDGDTDEGDADDGDTDEGDADDGDTDEGDADDSETDETGDGTDESGAGDEGSADETETGDESEELQADDETVGVEEADDDSAIPAVLGGTPALVTLVLLLLVIAALAAFYKYQTDQTD